MRQILLKRLYRWQHCDRGQASKMLETLEQGSLTAAQLLSGYCASLYKRLGTYEAVAKVTKLDRRTVKKHFVQFENQQPHTSDTGE